MSTTQHVSRERIYIKAEPSGEITVVRAPLGELLEIANGGLSAPREILACQRLMRRKRSVVTARGLFTSGVTGERGNVGLIKLLMRPDLSIPKTTDDDRGYMISLALSKVSIEFDCPLPKANAFKTNLLIEECIPVDLPEFVQDDTYGEVSGNVCIGYQYNGRKISNWSQSWVDRGFDRHFFGCRVGPSGQNLLFRLTESTNSQSL